KFPSMIPLDKYGEDTEPSALPWDEINKSNFVKVANLAPFIPSLAKLHQDRMDKDPNYKYLLEDIEEFKKRDAEKSIVLNETELKKQREQDEAKTLERDNIRRVAMGYKPLKKGESKPRNEDLDFLKIEAGQILTDYIEG